MLIRKDDLEELRASLEFHLDDKVISKNILDRLNILYKDRDYKMRDFIVSSFSGKPYGKNKQITGLDILKLINSHIKKLYMPYYDYIDKNLTVRGELENKKWLANIITFIVNYFSEKDSTMDIDFNMGVVSFVPEHPLPVRADVFINPFAINSK
jgi:hypothetical protein